MAKKIDADGLLDKMDGGGDFLLVNVLSNEEFEKQRIPGSINIPVQAQGFEDAAEDILPQEAEIIVYCAGFECRASDTAVKMLEEVGYANLIEYEGGMEDWIEKGNPVEGIREQE